MEETNTQHKIDVTCPFLNVAAGVGVVKTVSRILFDFVITSFTVSIVIVAYAVTDLPLSRTLTLVRYS